MLDHTHAPFIIGGDWQNSPDAVAATVIMSKFNCQIIDTEGPNYLAWLSVGLSAGVQRIGKPHCGLAVALTRDYAEVEVQQLQRFPPIGKVHALPQCWTTWSTK